MGTSARSFARWRTAHARQIGQVELFPWDYGSVKLGKDDTAAATPFWMYAFT